MKLYFEKDDWTFNNDEPIEEKLTDIRISINYPDQEQFFHLQPKERILEIDAFHKQVLKQILALKLLNDPTIIGDKKRPREVRTKLKFDDIERLEVIDPISVYIDAIDGGQKIEKVEIVEEQFFCVKMTVVIDIEGLRSKTQDIETRFVLIKARSFEDAYAKVEATKDTYAAPYLNGDGRIARWLIDSLDDCYQTDVFNAEGFNEPEGVEIYSKMGKRRVKK